MQAWSLFYLIMMMVLIKMDAFLNSFLILVMDDYGHKQVLTHKLVIAVTVAADGFVQPLTISIPFIPFRKARKVC